MARGRPRKPTAQHRIEGTLNTTRHGDRIDEALAIGTPVKPGWMTGTASDCWDLIVGNLPENAIAAVDAPALEVLCFWFAEFRRCAGSLHDPETEPVDELDLRNRAEKASKMFGQSASKFGLTPVDRAGLKLLPADSKETDPLLLMLQKRGQN